MEAPVLVKRYTDPALLLPVDLKEVFRYAGGRGVPEGSMADRLKEAVAAGTPVCDYRVCYCRLPLPDSGTIFSMPSEDLAKCLRGCGEVILFAATLGLGLDRLTRAAGSADPVKGLFLQGLGAERVERLCDVFCDEMKRELLAEGKTVTPRYSPGYGDLSLEAQKEVFALLDCSRRIGLTLNDSLLMTPTKSVTALFGIRPAE